MEEDHEELLQCTDDESLSEIEDQCCPAEKPEEHYLPPLTFFSHTKFEFFTTKISLILSTLVLLIVVPLYIDSANVRGNVFSIILVNILFATVIFIVTSVILKCLCEKYKDLRIFSVPIMFRKLFQISLIYMLCGFIFFYASDRNRVLCHLQDPIKGIVLVCALFYYFFFCRNLMGLHRIFATTTVIVGLFIAMDYGLCDEFVCRGYERRTVHDDAGPWSWKTHSIWTGAYIFGLTLFAAYFTLLDRHILPENESISHNLVISTSFLNTISRSVTASTSNQENPANQRQRAFQPSLKSSAIHFAMWIHIIGCGVVLGTFWVDFVPGIGKGATVAESWNYTLNGLFCHFAKRGDVKRDADSCGVVFWYSLVFQSAYVIFVATSIRFLILSQSAVYTIATMAYPLPLAGLWWTLFHAAPNGVLVWAPKLRGELVCSLIGLPIVTIGLSLLNKAHFAEYHFFKQAQVVSTNQRA